MGKMCVLLIAVLLCTASLSLAIEPGGVYNVGGMPDPYAGPTPPGMRFGDLGQLASVQTADYGGGYPGGGPGCPGCGYQFGVSGVPCDPAWRGPCIDWKLVGWYSSFRDKNDGGGGHCGHCGRCGTCSY